MRWKFSLSLSHTEFPIQYFTIKVGAAAAAADQYKGIVRKLKKRRQTSPWSWFSLSLSPHQMSKFCCSIPTAPGAAVKYAIGEENFFPFFVQARDIHIQL